TNSSNLPFSYILRVPFTIAENQLTMVEDIKHFDSPNYVFDLKRSTNKKLIFIEKTNRSNK
ncbi:MAG: hypothetical protein ABF767_12540, partial [Lentilactobacillus hilgardii]